MSQYYGKNPISSTLKKSAPTWAVDQDWTGDLVITNDVLYQLSYNGLFCKQISITKLQFPNNYQIAITNFQKRCFENWFLVIGNSLEIGIWLLPQSGFVGREGFEPPKPEGERFTVSCDRPLHHLPILTKWPITKIQFPSNHQFTITNFQNIFFDYWFLIIGIYLVIEIWLLEILSEPPVRLELTTHGLQNRRSTNWAKVAIFFTWRNAYYGTNIPSKWEY